MPASGGHIACSKICSTLHAFILPLPFEYRVQRFQPLCNVFLHCGTQHRRRLLCIAIGRAWARRVGCGLQFHFSEDACTYAAQSKTAPPTSSTRISRVTSLANEALVYTHLRLDPGRVVQVGECGPVFSEPLVCSDLSDCGVRCRSVGDCAPDVGCKPRESLQESSSEPAFEWSPTLESE
eukprot:3719366-Rhodomonas_salina.1